MKRAAFAIGLLFLLALATEGAAYLVQPLLKRRVVGIDFVPTWKIYESQRAAITGKPNRDTNTMFDPDLGWRYRPNFRSDQYNNNCLGLRGPRRHELTPPRGVLRVAAFGDSFVYGNEVRDEETWSSQLEAMHSGIEVLNAGVGGYGTDQAYLMYRKFGRAYEPKVVLIGFTTVQVPRNVNVYRRFYSLGEVMLVKPRFALVRDGGLELIPSPVHAEEDYWKYYDDPTRITELGKHDFWYQPLVYENPLYDYSATVRLLSQTFSVLQRKLPARNAIVVRGRLSPESEAFEITARILRLFVEDVRKAGATPIVLLFPDAYRLGADGAERKDAYQALVDRLRKDGLPYFDLATAFDRPVTRARHLMEGGHYSPHSNRLVARAIAAHLRGLGLLDVDGRPAPADRGTRVVSR